jgi:MbtH protein
MDYKINFDDETAIFKVVVNHDEMYSIWPADRENAFDWDDVGFSGNKAECLARINELWRDQRPLRYRQQMKEEALRRH